jgi:hypothetical protein
LREPTRVREPILRTKAAARLTKNTTICEPVHICPAQSRLNPRCWGFQGPSHMRRRDKDFRARRRNFFDGQLVPSVDWRVLPAAVASQTMPSSSSARRASGAALIEPDRGLNLPARSSLMRLVRFSLRRVGPPYSLKFGGPNWLKQSRAVSAKSHPAPIASVQQTAFPG